MSQPLTYETIDWEEEARVAWYVAQGFIPLENTPFTSTELMELSNRVQERLDYWNSNAMEAPRPRRFSKW